MKKLSAGTDVKLTLSANEQLIISTTGQAYMHILSDDDDMNILGGSVIIESRALIHGPNDVPKRIEIKAFNGECSYKHGKAAAPTNTAVPQILAGPAREGIRLLADVGVWEGNIKEHSYEWLRNGQVVGAGNDYVVKSEDVEAELTLRVTAHGYGHSIAAHSEPMLVMDEFAKEPVKE